LIFLLNQGHKRGNSTKYQLKPMKDMIGTISGAFGKNWCWNFVARIKCLPDFFNFFENAEPGVASESYVQFFESFSGKKFTLIGVLSEKLCPI
jgi:hypothetical protein